MKSENVGYLRPRSGDRRAIEHRALLDRINERVGAARDLEDLVDFLLGAAAELGEADRVSIAFIDESGARLVSRSTAAAYAPIILARGFSQELGGSSLERVLETGEIRLIGDLEAHLASKPDSVSTRLLVEEGVRSSMTCPLTVDERRVGVLFCSSRRPRAFDETAARAYMEIARRIGQVAEKAYRIDQLEAANRAYTEMLGFVVHELKSPIANIISKAELLRGGYLGDLAAPQREAVERMIANGEHLLGLIGDYLDLARVEGGGLTLEGKAGVALVREVVLPAVELSEATAAARGIGIRVEAPTDDIALRCDPRLLRVAATNLVGNAVKYADDGGAVRVTVSIVEGKARVEVWNSGPGFAPEQKGRLFRRFSRIDSAALMKRKGTGVGLYTTAAIVRLHEGRIGADSVEGEWASFWFEIPQDLAVSSGGQRA